LLWVKSGHRESKEKPGCCWGFAADMVEHDYDVCFVPIAGIPSFDYFVGERPGNERFDAQNKFKLVYLFDSSHLCHSGL
jgi:hypothetical protein